MTVVKTTASFPREDLERVNELARVYNTSRSAIVTLAVAEYLMREEAALADDDAPPLSEEEALARASARGWLTDQHLALAARIAHREEED
jgi:predicted transcriptional regulator